MPVRVLFAAARINKGVNSVAKPIKLLLIRFYFERLVFGRKFTGAETSIKQAT